MGGNQDVLADDVDRPIGPDFREIRQSGIVGCAVSDKRDIVDQRVEPDVRDVIVVERQLDAPLQAFFGAGNAEIEAGIPLERVQELGFTEGREHRVGRGFEVSAQPRSVVAEFEIPIFLRDFDDFAPFRAEIPGFVAVPVLEELLLAHRVVARVRFFVELALVFKGREDRTDACFVAGVGGGGPTVVFDAESGPQRRELRGDAGDKING